MKIQSSGMRTPAGFEAAAGNLDNQYVLWLYITGTTQHSARAITNIRQICEDYLKGHYELKILDISQKPMLAAGAQIIAAPTLIKKLPLPMRRFIGDMSKTESILRGLGLYLRKTTERDVGDIKN